jgi:hypothetical protein
VPPTNEQWARGYARQALSDLRAREALVNAKDSKIEKCHRLHFLQMAAEKVCKAYLLAAAREQDSVSNIRRSHAYIAGPLPQIARQFYGKLNDNNAISRWEISEIRRLSREIQTLAPACREGDIREDNSEYPWEGTKGNICVPCEYDFPNIDDRDRGIVRLINLIREAAKAYSE